MAAQQHRASLDQSCVEITSACLAMMRAWLPLLTGLLFSGSYIAGKYTTADLGPLMTTVLRYGVALVFLTVLVVFARGNSLKVQAKHMAGFLALGVFGIVGYHYFFFLSLHHTEVANTAIINALSPIVTGLLAAALIGERLTRRNYLGVLIAVAGVIWLLSRGQPLSLFSAGINLGDSLMLLAVLCFAIYAVLVKSLIAHYSGLTLAFYGTAAGVVLLLAITPIEQPLVQLHGVSIRSLWSVAYMGIAASGIGYLTFNLSIKELGPTRTSTVVYGTVPLIVAVLGWSFLSETLDGNSLLSMMLVISGLILAIGRPNQT